MKHLCFEKLHINCFVTVGHKLKFSICNCFNFVPISFSYRPTLLSHHLYPANFSVSFRYIWRAKTYIYNKTNITRVGRDSSVGKSPTSHAGELGSNPSEGLTWVTTMYKWEGKRLTAVKVILHQLAWLTCA